VTFRLPNRAARAHFLNRHLLAEPPQGPAQGHGLLDVIERLGFVQLDSINTVARAHDLILFARRRRYRPEHLKRLYERDRGLFEHWTHDASVIPMGFYSWWHLRRQRDAEELKGRWRKDRRAGFESQFQVILDRIAEEGPLCASDVGEGEARGSGGWWDWHPSKTALEYLWRSGALCVVGRDGFRKRYDLTERFVDNALTVPAPEVEQTIDWCCRAALTRLGFATSGELAAFWRHVTPAECKTWCAEHLANGTLIEIEVEGADKSWRKAVAFADLPDLPQPQVTKCLRVLSPFDPALRDRKRAERLFGFNYRIEIFVPEPKRVYGYYVFPILEGDRVIARVDKKAFRDADDLVVRALWPERRVRWTKARHTAFEAELARLIRLAGVSRFSFEQDWLRDPVV
jgi:uncharacterized protein YcaQ